MNGKTETINLLSELGTVEVYSESKEDGMLTVLLLGDFRLLNKVLSVTKILQKAGYSTISVMNNSENYFLAVTKQTITNE